MKVNQSGVYYCEAGPLPFFFGFVPNEKAWKKEVARLGDLGHPYPAAAGAMTWFNTKQDALICLMTVDESQDKGDPVKLTGIVAHEAMHVWQKALEHIGEDMRPSFELEAYHYQAIFEQLLEAYVKARNPKLFRLSQPKRKQL